MYPIFPHDNTVSRGTLDFFQEQVKGNQDKVSGSEYSTRETQYVGLVVEYASVTSLWRNTKRQTPVAVAGRSVG